MINIDPQKLSPKVTVAEQVVEGKDATYRITSRVVPPIPRDKVYNETPVFLIAHNVEKTGKEALP